MKAVNLRKKKGRDVIVVEIGPLNIELAVTFT